MGRWMLLAACLLSVVVDMAAQGPFVEQYRVNSLDLEAGLPNSNVNQIFSDSRGFVWVSTYGGGVVRYDGYSFVSPNIAMPGTVASNSCKSVAEDGYQRLWIAYDEFAVVLDMKTMAPIVPPSAAGNIASMLNRASVKVYCDSKGCIWHVTTDSIFRYAFGAGGKVAHVASCAYQGNVPDIAISDIDGNGTVWCNIDGGLYRLSVVGNRLERRSIAPCMSRLDGLYVTDMLNYDSRIWIATNTGVFAYDPYAGSLTNYRHTDSSTSLSHDFATSLAILPDGRLIIGTLCGVNVMDRKHENFEHWNAATKGIHMPSDFVHTLMVRDGQIWIGTETAGIVKLSPRPLMLISHVHSNERPASLSPNPVNAIYDAPDGTLWVGTVEGGLNRRTGIDEFEHFTTHNSPLSHNSVSVLEPDSHGRLWIGTWGGGLNVIQLDGSSKPQQVVMPAQWRQPTSYIGSLAYDKYNDALWIGCNEGIFLYNMKSRQLEVPFRGNRDIRGCIGAQIDRNGQLWMGCMTGACIIDVKGGRDKDGMFGYRRLRSKLDFPGSLVVDKISCFCEASDGTLWLGSNGYGLYRRLTDEKTGKERFECLSADDGLAANAVKGIAEDEQGRLWITTSNGLSIFDPRARTFINYREREGLPSQHFYFNSAVRGSNGSIFLGSVGGLAEVRGEYSGNDNPAHLAFTRLTVDNQEITAANSSVIDADIAQAHRIRLHESNKSVEIDFSALTFADEIQGHYSYRMRGFDDEWITLKPAEHSVRYTGMQPGSYVFEVRYMTGDDDANASTISISVDVAPYFWKSWWFRCLLALIMMAAAVWLYRTRMAAWKKQEAEKLLAPIRKVLDESDAPELLQARIQNILDGQAHLKNSFHRTLEKDKQNQKAKQKTLMEQATEIMEQNYMNSDFGIAEFADAIGMGRSLLAKKMHAETGVSTGQFIRNYRLSVAKKMILENPANRNITEIAYQVGFNDPKYFTRCFTRQYGNSPSTYMEGDEVDVSGDKSNENG
ncbi:MAG: helix-turn-helix domain-containing protein [Prevotella sp.]|nr:helix-turn-helix domain-containing protein [Prevotella sp.]